MDKTELLAMIQSDRAQLDGLLAAMSAEQMCKAALEHQWSVKDVLAHIAAWERKCVGWIQAGLHGEKPDKPEAGYTGEDIDKLNKKTFLENRNRSLDDVQSDYRQSYQQILAQIQTLEEDDITNPQRFSWTNGRTLVPYIAANTYEHYQEHIEQIRKWLENEDNKPDNKRHVSDILESLPGHQVFHNADEVDASLRGERDSWER
ncbi:MAG TPA: DinB family protein [Ktedonobacteraceae bacterium]|nr:DinB family protein [Ktedonobacteraceae bacterium]